MKKSNLTIEALLEIIKAPAALIKQLEARIKELNSASTKTAAIAPNHHQVMGYQNHHATHLFIARKR